MGGSPPVYRPKVEQCGPVHAKNSPMKSAFWASHEGLRAGPRVVFGAPTKPLTVYPPQTVIRKEPLSALPVYRPQQAVSARLLPVSLPVFKAHSSVINMMPEVGTKALTSYLGYEYGEAEALLYAGEKAQLDALWGSSYQVTGNTSNIQKRRRAAQAAQTVGTWLNQILATPRVTYSENFTANHLSDADVDRATAKRRGDARNPLPQHNTVFKESYMRGLLMADAVGKADGDHWLRFQSPHPPEGRISLASNRGGQMVAEDPGLYFVAVKYKLSTTTARRPQTIRAFHIETDDD
jgi:hypothetical protein